MSLDNTKVLSVTGLERMIMLSLTSIKTEVKSDINVKASIAMNREKYAVSWIVRLLKNKVVSNNNPSKSENNMVPSVAIDTNCGLLVLV